MGAIKIDISEIIGTPNAILQKFGLQLKDVVLQEVKNGNTVELDFTSLNNATTGFFHASIGNLYQTLNGTYSKTVSIKGLEKNDTWQDKYDDAIDLVKNPEKANEIDKAISELFAE